MLRRRKCRTGFTLVELLIVITIIGILAGMMTLAAGTATDKAQATRIVNNMVVLKKACLLYYLDNGQWPNGLKDGSTNSSNKGDTAASTVLKGYVSNSIGSEYNIISVDSKIFVKYNAADKLSAGVREQIALMAPKANLWNTSSWSDNTEKINGKNESYYHYYYTSGNSSTGIKTFHLLVTTL